jgi:hypothetical protein
MACAALVLPILLFKDVNESQTGLNLFSAAVIASLAVSAQDIRPNLQDTAFYLPNIHQLTYLPKTTESLLPSPRVV